LCKAVRKSALKSFSCDASLDDDDDEDEDDEFGGVILPTFHSHHAFDELGRLSNLIESEWFAKVVTLCSARTFSTTLGQTSRFRLLPMDLVRRIAETLPED
jgi:hypothetical protein